MMSNNIVVSAEKAEQMNKMVSAKLGKHLFIFCNYNPDSIEVYSEDAKFIKAAMNMYKVLVDASIYNNLRPLCKKFGITYDYRKFDYILETVNAIRTVMGHNIDYQNGDEERKEILHNWFSDIVGTNSPKTSSEFEKLEKELEKYGDESINIIETIVNGCAQNPQKQDIVDEWEQLIIGFYRRPNSKNIIEGQIRLAYIARLGSTRNIHRVQIAEWISKMYSYKEKEQIKNLREISRGKAFSPQVLKNIDEKIRENEKKISERDKVIASFVGKGVQDLNNYDYSDYYISKMPDRIEKTLEEGNVDSLLPQDIVQQIIETDFSGIPL